MASGISKIKYVVGAIAPTNLKTVTVTVNAAATSGTATVRAGAKILGILPAGNQDQFVDNVAISGTTLTVTLSAAATGANQFNVTVLEV
ncbi:hypothetical protein [Arthrobacter sp. KNU40]|uniref:hypothetical protein n=1 Tax=Arthrobacter sp. KNU40 TaxID=3447965 RepID=UPI003F6068B7